MEDPHFSFPFRLRPDRAAAVVREGGTDDDAMDQAEVLLRTERGSREEIPQYGVPDQVFLEGGADMTAIQEALRRWAPSAEAKVEFVELVELSNWIRVKVRSRD